MQKALAIVLLCTSVLLSACQTQRLHRDNEAFMPYVDGNEVVIAKTPVAELRRSQLISTNLVSALVQIPEMQLGTTTLQISSPKTVFGNTLIRALEDAGFGIQRVTADQGLNYVTYGKRYSETDAGPVTDYSVAIGDIEVRREYDSTRNGVFPRSIMFVSGTKRVIDIELDDSIFIEQGGSGESFISGVGNDSLDGQSAGIKSVTVNDYDKTPINKRTEQMRVLTAARNRYYQESAGDAHNELSGYDKLRRTVMMFENKATRVMGRGNKTAVRLLVREYKLGDIYSISACTDADGKDKASEVRAVRALEEFVGYGVSPIAIRVEPCIRASYRHSSDDAPVAVTVSHYRSAAKS